jgi:hypothetical protein
MSLTMKVIRKIERLNAKHFVLAGVFMLALAGSVSLGLASRGNGGAAVIRDTDSANSIDGANRNGGIGAADPQEFVKDLRDNVPNDLQTIYADPRVGGLTPNLYDQFQREAVDGTLFRDGHIEVKGQTVWTGVWTMGRTTLGNKQRDPITIGNKTYYTSAPSISFAASRQSLPVMVWFDDKGEVRMAVMNACGNGVGGGTKVKNSVTCKTLNQTQPDAKTKPNTYRYTTNATVAGNAKISRVVYHFSDDNTTITKTGENAHTQPVDHTFTKDGEVSVTVFASVPNGKEIQATAVADCKKRVKYVPPFYVCTNLVATAINDSKKAFRFTVNAKTDNTGQTVLRDVDFTLDGKDVTKGVTAKDDKGNIYKEYTFTDDVQHKVKASLNFNTALGVQAVACEASVTPAKTPVCEVPGKSHLPPNSPECGYCKPNIPIGDAQCAEVKSVSTLAVTGPGDTAGLIGSFIGIAIVGFFAHNLFLRRRSVRQ